ncbi:hypothetical protein HK097_000651 [Rhizophlyctis rosea]|uniref:F-box domain-containing protein n=1 Tax=Rhizophlyctis rosea TaxID=64517 RepID=A0AAD5SGF2_9FUNG|nr:hypothetical protein HK097_000651 [Rhizophlyctis rosea]
MLLPPIPIDVFLLILAHPSITVPTLLRLERVCKRLCALIRDSPIQIWKTKLLRSRSFTPKCLPVLYGQENWRDVAVIWHTWGRQWVPSEVGVVDVPQLHDGETLERCGNGILREVESIFRFSTFPGPTYCIPTAVHSSGRIALEKKYPEDIQDGVKARDARHIRESCYDTVVAGAEDLDWSRVHRNTHFLRSNLTLRITMQNGILMDNLRHVKTGEVLRKAPREAQTALWQTTILGDQYILEHWSFSPPITPRTQCSITPINGAYDYFLPHEHCYKFNETVGVTIIWDNNNNSLPRLRLLRLADLKAVQEVTRDLTGGIECVTRYNIFIQHWRRVNENQNELDCFQVYDVRLNHLYNIPSGAMSSSVGLGDGLFATDSWTDRDMIWIYDPFQGTCSVLRKKSRDGQKSGLAYLVVVVEYPVDDFGVRTGAGGRHVVYYKRAD